MASFPEFSTRFWDSELGNFQSYDALIRKVKEDQKSSRDYLDFLKLRVAAEEMHSKNLAKLAKTSGAKSEIGILSGGWKNCHLLCADLETIVTKSVAKLNAELDHAQELLGKQLEQRKKEDDEVREVQQNLKNAINKLQNRQKQHQGRCKELEKTRQTLKDILRDSTATKDSAKAATALARGEQQWESSCIALNQAESQVEEIRDIWESKTEQALEVMQALQEQRLNALANLQELLVDTIKEQTNMGLMVLEQWTNYDEIDVQSEVGNFALRHGNNNARPINVSLTDFDSADLSHGLAKPNESSTKITLPSRAPSAEPQTGMAGTLQRKFKKMLPLSGIMHSRKSGGESSKPNHGHQLGDNEDEDSLSEYDSFEAYRAKAMTEKSLSPRPSKPEVKAPYPSPSFATKDDQGDTVYAVIQKVKKNGEVEVSVENEMYGAIVRRKEKEVKDVYGVVNKAAKKKAKDAGEYSFGDGGGASSFDQQEDDFDDDEEVYGVGSFSGGSDLMRVIYDYTAKHPTDITLREGELVRLMQVVSSEWVEVKSSSGMVGHFPRNYIEPADS